MLTLPEVEAAFKKRLSIPPVDVVQARMELPLTKRLFPLGFPMDVHTNSAAVIDLVTETWGAFHSLFDTPPIQLRIGILPGDTHECAPATECRVHSDIFSFIADAHNYGIGDMRRGISSIWLQQGTLQYPSYIRHSFLDCAAMIQIATRYATGVHSGMIERNGVGILLCGDSGAGKSTLSYACARAGWTYITDDGSYLVHDRQDLLAVGNCFQVRFRPSAGDFFPEVQGLEVTQRSGLGKPSIEFRPSAGCIRVAQSAPVHHLVLLNRREGRNEPLRPYPPDIVRAFLRQGRFAPLDNLPTQHAMIDKLLDGSVLELRYRDLDWAIEQLEALAAGAPLK
jgi:hypothetical protein